MTGISKKVIFTASAAVLFFVSLHFISAEEIYMEELGFVVDLPIGWDVMDVSETRYTFNDFTGDAFLQIKVYPGDTYESAETMFDEVGKKLQASGEGELFDYYGRQAIFAIINFASGNFQYRGYGIFADGLDYDLAVISFCSPEQSTKLNDYIVSALDSFSLNTGGRQLPGPVSTYYLSSYTEKDRKTAATVFEGESVIWQVDMHAVETSQTLIEREARILADYRPQDEAGVEAWKRFYRMIYRDCYSKLDYPAALIEERLSDSNDSYNTAVRLLDWLQGFNYSRTGGSDLLSPLYAAAFEDGDCDSRALLYTILLNHYGIDSVVMVSAVHSHAMGTADVPGPGARMRYKDKAYLVAETTADVALGQIASDMSDPANWVVIPFLEGY